MTTPWPIYKNKQLKCTYTEKSTNDEKLKDTVLDSAYIRCQVVMIFKCHERNSCDVIRV